MLDENKIREELSVAYIHAVASRAGYAFERVLIDRDSVDGRVFAKGLVTPNAFLKSPSIAFQLKATSTALPTDPIAFALDQKNYQELLGHNAEPRYLALLVLPEDPSKWLELTADALLLRRAMYWLGLAGLPETDNAVSTTVYIPRANVLDVPGMKRLIHAAAMQEVL